MSEFNLSEKQIPTDGWIKDNSFFWTADVKDFIKRLKEDVEKNEKVNCSGIINSEEWKEGFRMACKNFNYFLNKRAGKKLLTNLQEIN